MDMGKNPNRKYFDWRILNFCLRKKVDIGTWIDIDTGIDSNKNTKTGTNNYQTIDKKGLFYLTIHQEINLSNQKRIFFDWMGMNEEILNRPISNVKLWFFPEFLLLYNGYKIKPWVIPIKLLLLNFNENENVRENKNINGKQKRDLFISSNEKKSLELKNRNQEEKEPTGRGDLGSDAQNQQKQKNVEEDYAGSNMKKRRKKKQYKSKAEAELDFLLKKHLLFQLRWNDPLNQRILNNVKVYCLLLRLINPREIALSSIQRGEMSLDIMLIHKDLTLTELMKKAILIIEPVRLSVKSDRQFILYQTINISLVHKSKHKTNQRYRDKRYVDKKNFYKFIARHQRMIGNRDENHYDLLIPENILSPRRRRELRTLICFNSRNRNNVNRNPIFCNRNNVKNCGSFLDENKQFDRHTNKLKFFLWPNYRLEDLACMNRYWFDTTNGSRFSMLRIHMYPRLKIR